VGIVGLSMYYRRRLRVWWSGTGSQLVVTRCIECENQVDTIFLEGMQFYGYHGVNPEERSLGQRFLVDIELTTTLQAVGRSDKLEDTINYSAVYQRVRAIVEGPPRSLIEAVAEEIAMTLLNEFPTTRVIVTVRKPEVALRGATLAAAGVRIVRPAADRRVDEASER
jgi:dihydroneopterin aldolase